MSFSYLFYLVKQVHELLLLAWLVLKYLFLSCSYFLYLVNLELILLTVLSKAGKYCSTSKTITLGQVKQVHELFILALLVLKYLLLLPCSPRWRKEASAARRILFYFSPHFFSFCIFFILFTWSRRSRKAVSACTGSTSTVNTSTTRPMLKYFSTSKASTLVPVTLAPPQWTRSQSDRCSSALALVKQDIWY